MIFYLEKELRLGANGELIQVDNLPNNKNSR